MMLRWKWPKELQINNNHIDFGSARMDFQLFALALLVLACVERSLASCVVDSFTVKDDFDPQRVSMQNSNC